MTVGGVDSYVCYVCYCRITKASTHPVPMATTILLRRLQTATSLMRVNI